MNTGQHDAVGLVRGLGIIMGADFAPPKHSADYEAKPLPAIPPRASFSIPDMKAVFKTSKQNLTNRQCAYDWDKQGNNISLDTDGRGGTPRSRSLPENDSSSIPTTPSNEILSPQPRHSRQKILRLTGNISPSMTLASFEPSQHNSQQKIKQLTGLDVGSSVSSEGQTNPELHPFQGDEVSPVSPSESTYSVEGLEATISEPESDFSDYTLPSDANGVTTQLTAPSFSTSPSRPVSSGPDSQPTRVRLSSFALREPEETAGPREPLTDFKAHYRQGSNSSTWGSSRKSSATGIPHYASGGDTVKCSPRASVSATSIVDAGPPSPFFKSPFFKQRSLIWDTSPGEHRTASGEHDLTSPSSSPPPPPHSSPPLPPPHSSPTPSVNRKPGSLSDRRASSRGRVPTPLEPTGDRPPKTSKFSPPQRTPYPPPLPPPPSISSAFDADSDDGKRTSFLGKVFRGAGGGGGGNGNKRHYRGPASPTGPSPYSGQNFVPTSPSSAYGGGGGPLATSSPPPPPPIPESHPHWSRGRDAPRSSAEGGGAGGGAHGAHGAGGRPLSGGAGLFQRARRSVGLMSRSEKRRNTLRGKLRTVET